MIIIYGETPIEAQVNSCI